MLPTIGRIVHYTLTPDDVTQATQARQTSGSTKKGNPLAPGDVFPMLITRVWGEGEGAHVQGQVFLDGNDSLWVTSVPEGEGPRTWAVPPRT